MKFMILLLAILAGVWLIKRNAARRVDADRSMPPHRTLKAPVTMVACRQCGTHVPEGECVVGRAGCYCSEAHRQVSEGAH